MSNPSKKVLFIDTVHPYLQENLTSSGFVCEEDYENSKAIISEKIDQYFGIVLRSRFRIDKDFLDKAVNLKFIARAGSGMENIEVEYAESLGIKCIHAPEGNMQAVAEHALGMLLSLANNLHHSQEEIKQGIWLREENRGFEIFGKTIGIIGFGHTGSAFAKVLTGFDVEILAYDKYSTANFSKFPFVKLSSLNEIYEKADIVSIHLPLNEETKYYVNADFYKNFRKNIIIINTSRGKILNISNLVEALKAEKIKGACLDVLEYETSSFEKIEIPKDLIFLTQQKNVRLSPHIAGWTQESHYKLSYYLFQKIKANFIK
jgi:D-3-phosphoglycerate dehydrogenase / 2-oxoglutarate reductase